MLKRFKAIALVSALLVTLFCATDQIQAADGTAALTFLRIAPSARAEGLGEAFVAVADDANACYWNPAGLVNVELMSLSLMHLIYWDSSSYEYAAFNYPMSDKLKLGFHVIYLNYGSMEKTTETTSGGFGGTSGTFSPSDLALGGSAAIALDDSMQVGLTIKYAMQSIDTDTVSAFAADVGGLYAFNFMDMNFVAGLALSNVGTKVKEDSLPMTLRGGLSSKFTLMEENDLLAAVSVYYPFESGKLAENIGVEYWYDKMFAVRVGYKVGYDVGGLAAGIGFKSILEGMFGYQVDYCYAPSGNLGDTHRISVTLRFDEQDTGGKSKSKGGIRISPTKN